MNEIGKFFSDTLLIFVLIAGFAIFALIGFIAESKNKGKRRVSSNVVRPQNNVEEDLEKIKSNLANNNKSLSSVISNQNGANNSFGTSMNNSNIGNMNSGLNTNSFPQSSNNFNNNIDKL